MRICFVSQEVAGIRGGGIGTYVVEAGKALRRDGHETWLVTRAAGAADREKLKGVPGFDHVVLADGGAPERGRPRFLHGEPHYGYSHLVHRVLQRVGVDFDYIEFPDYRAEGLVALQEQRQFGTYGSTVLGVTLHTPTWECWSFDGQSHRFDLALRELCSLEDEAIRIAQALSCPSSLLADTVRERLELTQEIAILPYPMELGTTPPLPPKPVQTLEQLSFLYFGRLEPRKGVEELIEAFRSLPDLRLRLVGADTPLSPWGTSLRSHLRPRLPSNVELQPPVNREALLSMLPEYDVCILPSLFENWPNACLEAMGASRVVVGGNRGGMAEMIEDGVNGFLVDGGSPEDIVRVLSEVLPRHLDRLDAIGRRAAQRARELANPQSFSDRRAGYIRSQRTATQSPPPPDLEAHQVSVVIPFADRSSDLQRTLESVSRQTHGNLDVLIVAAEPQAELARNVLRRRPDADLPARVLVGKGAGPSTLRNCGIRAATGEFFLCLEPGDTLREDAILCTVASLKRQAGAGFATVQTARMGGSSSKPLDTLNPMPFDRPTALLGNRFGEAGTLFRRGLFQDGTLAYDESLPSGYDLALWMDLDGLGIHGERIPRVLHESRGPADDMLTQAKRLAAHPATMGLLIQRHLAWAGDDERRALTTLFATAGASIAGSLGHDRIEIAGTLSDLARRAPRLTAAFLQLVAWARGLWPRPGGGG